MMNSEEELVPRRERLEHAYRSVMDRHWRQVESSHTEDSLERCFAEQAAFMSMLRADGRFPDWPLDLSSKENQRKLQGFLWDMVREVSEASAALKNRVHRVQEQEFDRSNFLEEMADAFAFFMESLILAGFTAEDLSDQYHAKMQVNREGLITGDR